MHEVIHIPEKIEILPPAQMVEFREALASMERFYRDLDSVYEEARRLRDLKTWDRPTRTHAGELTTKYKELCKEAESTIKRYKDAVNRFKEEYILRPEKKVNNRAEEIRAILSPKMADWDREDERQQQAERDRIAREVQADLDRKAEVKKQADEAHAKQLKAKRVEEIRADLRAGKFGNPKLLPAKRKAQKLLEEAGAVEESLLAKASADELEAKEQSKKTASTVKVESLKPTVAGNVKRVNYSAACADRRQFILTMFEYYRGKNMEAFERLLKVVNVADDKLSSEAREHIKTSPEDTKHDLTVKEFEALYPYVTVKEDRSY